MESNVIKVNENKVSVEYILMIKMDPKVKPQKNKIISIVAFNCKFDNYEIDPATNN